MLPLSFGADVMNEGAFAQLSCIVTEGDEPLTISWSIHGSNITSDLGILTTPIGSRGSMLIISRVEHQHRGEYTCIATNIAGSRSQAATLRVNGNFQGGTGILFCVFFLTFLTIHDFLVPPELIPLTFGKDVVDEGNFAQLSCIATAGDEPLSVSWTFHGQGISSDLGIVTTPIGSRGSMLIISSVGHRHSGNYTCTAKNAGGVRSETAVLRVNGTYNKINDIGRPF